MNEIVLKDVVNICVGEDHESIELYKSSIYNENGLGVENSRYTQKWDARYNRIKMVAEKYALKHAKIQRGNLWRAIFLIDENNEIYVFFKAKNLKNIFKKGKSTHYLILLNLFNEHLNSLKPVEEQMSFGFDLEESDINELKIQAKEVVRLMEGIPKKVNVISFNDQFHNFAEWLVFNSKQEIVFNKNLSHLIDSDYKFDLEADNVEPEKIEIKQNRITRKKQITRLRK